MPPRMDPANIETELNNLKKKWLPKLVDYAWAKVRPHLLTWLTLGANRGISFVILKLGPKYGGLALTLLGLAVSGGVVAGEKTDTFEPVTWANEAVNEIIDVFVEEVERDPLGYVDTPESQGIICDGTTIVPVVIFEDLIVNKHPTAVFAIEVNGSATTDVYIGELIVDNVTAPNMRIIDSTFRTVEASDIVAEFTFTPSPGSTTAPLFVGAGEGFSNHVGTADHLIVDGTTADCFIQTLIFRNIEVHGGDVSFDDMIVNSATFTNLKVGDTVDDPDWVFGSDNTVGSASTTAFDDTQDFRTE